MAASGAAQAETLVVDTAFQLKTADPAREFEPTANVFMHAIYQNLVTFSGGDLTKLVPSLASLPQVSADSETFTFELDPAAKFSDGSPVTVDDVIFSLNRVANVKGSPSFLMDGITVSAGSKPGEVVLTAATPDPGLPFKLTNPALAILNSKALKAHGGLDDATASTADKADAYLATASLGSGPYILEKFDIASEVDLKRNPAYWGPPAAYDSIVIRNVDNSAQQMNVMRGTSQIALDLRPDQASSLGKDFNVEEAAGSDIAFLLFNFDPAISSVTTNKDFREAVTDAIDYEGVLNIVGDGAQRSGGLVPSMFGGALPGSDGAKQDVAAAKAALARSGIKDPAVNLAYASDLTKDGVSFSDIAAKLQEDLQAIGIKVTLQPSPVSSHLDGYRAGKLEMAVEWWGPDFPDPSDYLLFGPGQLVGLRAGWKAGAAPDITDLGAKAAVESDPAKRNDLYAAWQKAVNAEGPFIPLFQPATTVVLAKTLEPLPFNAMWTVDLGAAKPAAK